MPPTRPSVALLLTGNGEFSTPPLVLKLLRAGIVELVILEREDVDGVGVQARG